MFAVIMAGGIGQRFWPRSRRGKPKQLLDLTGQGTMIRLTVDRLSGLFAPEEILVVTNRTQRAAIEREISAKVPSENIIPEPVGRNTSAAIGLAAILLKRRARDSLMLVLPADHIIEPVDRFESAVRAAASYISEEGGLLTFGIQPTRAETGYGYIQAGKEVGREGAIRIFEANAFLEKPDSDAAKRFVKEGTYFWNSGMFMWKTEGILEAFESYLPELHALLLGLEEALETASLESALESVYPKAPSISVDYGIMEKADNVVVLRADFRWNDVGSWEYLRDIRPTDGSGNASVGDHIFIDSSGNTVFSPDRLVGLVGIENVVVVDSGDAILVCRRDRVQDVRKVVEYLERHGKEKLY